MIDVRIYPGENDRNAGSRAGGAGAIFREGGILRENTSIARWQRGDRAIKPGLWLVSAATPGLVALCAPCALAAAQVLGATMTGAQETPPNASSATGTCSASMDPAILQVTFNGTFAGLAAPASAASLRGLAGPGSVGPVLLTRSSLTAGLSGTFSGSGTVTPEQAAGIVAGNTYCEVDDAAFPSGEIRGQLLLPLAAPGLPLWAMAWLAGVLGCAGIVSRRIVAKRSA